MTDKRQRRKILRLYGHYGSQPFRTVAWLLKMHRLPFEFVKVDPMSGSTRDEQFLSKFPLGLIPAMEEVDEDGGGGGGGGVFRLSEASAMVLYLCEKHGWVNWYPSAEGEPERRARVHQYLSHHGEGPRRITRRVFRPALDLAIRGEGRGGGLTDDVVAAEFRRIALEEGEKFQDAFLRDCDDDSSDFIAGGNVPTVADLLAYPELAQVPQVLGYEYDGLPRLRRWIERMGRLPGHDDVHRTVFKIGAFVQRRKSKL